ncbi:hypothetical protein BC830DRAFT_1087358 [Chytriomyces sp. MP71]|nr:hypothetical protein BC830DRAFT_1087358 [Chytriomyces sp. MP71]
MLECLDPVLTIAAALSLGKDPFATQFGESGSVGAKKFKNGDSDLATMANAYSEWRNHICKNAREKGSGWNAAREFAVENGLNFTDLNMIEEARMQLLRVLGSGGVLDWDGRADNPPRPLLATVPAKANRNGTNQSIVLAALAAGIYPSVAVFTPLPAASNRAAGSVPILHLQNGSSDKIDVHSKSVVGKEGLTPGSWYGMYSMTKSGDRIIAWDLNCLGRHRTRLIKADGDKVKMCCVPKTATLLSLFASRVNAVFDRCLAQMGQGTFEMLDESD